mmetsp:Transcript_35659/g.52324  ORF Transcript_35659/g.52324 Transcript_35659/m.52324 type:complete len:88 (-) Transcript_35659:108-371(-)
MHACVDMLDTHTYTVYIYIHIYTQMCAQSIQLLSLILLHKSDRHMHILSAFDMHPATHYSSSLSQRFVCILQHTATHCKTLQHNATQ